MELTAAGDPMLIIGRACAQRVVEPPVVEFFFCISQTVAFRWWGQVYRIQFTR
jgi:hypothetical protein